MNPNTDPNTAPDVDSGGSPQVAPVEPQHPKDARYGYKVFTPKVFDAALAVSGLTREFLKARSAARKRLNNDFWAAQWEVGPLWERRLLDMGYRVGERGELIQPSGGVLEVSGAGESKGLKGRGIGGVSGSGSFDSFRRLFLAVEKLGRQCTPRQAVVWAFENYYHLPDEIDPSTVPGPGAVRMLDLHQNRPDTFSDHYNKLLARAELEDEKRFESSGESQLSALEPLSDGLLDPQRETA